MDKFIRNYELEVEGADKSKITIRPPFTVQFDITRNVLTSANVCQLRIYNLGKKNRNLIRFNISNFNKYQSIHFKAGYGDKMTTIFAGNISQAWSFRQGVDTITQIECFDGGFAYTNSKISTTFGANLTQEQIIKKIASELQHVKLGAIGATPIELSSRGSSYVGNGAKILSELSGGGFFIDRGVAHVLADDEVIDDGIPPLVINAQSGLLGTPILEETIVRVDMIFEPNLHIGYPVIVRSISEDVFDGEYKINSVSHRGTISDSVGGEVITSAGFFFKDVLKGIKPG